MPEIPQLAEEAGLQYNRPDSVANVDAAGITGEGLQRAGNAVMGLGVDLSEIDNRKAAARRSLDSQSAHQQGIQTGLDVYNQVLMTGKPDGSDYVQKFNELYDKQSTAIAKSFESESMTQEAVQTSLLNARNEFNFKIQNQARTKSTEYLNNQVRGAMTSANAIVYQDPTQFDQQSAELAKTMSSLVDSKFYTKDTAVLYQRKAAQEMAQTAVLSMVDKQQFTTAKELLTNKFAPLFEYNDLKTMTDMINTRQIQYTDHLLKQEDRADRQQKKQEERDQKSNTAQLMVAFGSAKTPDDIAQATQQGISMLQKNSITRAQYDAAKEVGRDATTPPLDDMAKEHYWERITDPDNSGINNIDRIREDAMTDKNLSSKSKIEILKAVEAHTAAEDSGPAAQDGRAYMRHALAAKWGKEGIFPDMWPQDKRASSLFQEKQILREVSVNGGDYVKATDKVISGGVSLPPAVSVPGLNSSEQSSVKALQKGGQRIFQGIQNGTLKWNDTQVKNFQKAYEQRLDWLNTNHPKKEGQ